MRSKKFSQALGDVDSKYIDEALNYRPARKISRWMGLGAAAACVCMVVCAAHFAGSGDLRQPENTPMLGAADTSQSAQQTPASGTQVDSAEPDKPAADTVPDDSGATHDVPRLEGEESAGAQTSGETQPNADRKPLKYSELVPDHNSAELPAGGSGSMSIAAFSDIEAFGDSDMGGTMWMVEGVITEMYTKHYEFTTPCDKFEEGGVLHNFRDTVVYKMKVEKPWHGDIQPGDVITIEDEVWAIEGYAAMHKGGRFVIPIYYCGDKIQTYEDVIEGDLTRDGEYTTYYVFHPQIQRVDGGYIVPGDWEHLISADSERIEMDVEQDGIMAAYWDKMYFIPDNVFADRMTNICEKINK